MRFLLGLFLFTATLASATAQTPTVEFLGTRFEKKYESKAPSGKGGLVEFGLLPEDIKKKWTRMVAYRHYPDMKMEPKQAAINHGQQTKKRDPLSRMAISTNDKTGEAIIDFITGQDEIIEFNAIKYAKAPGGGLVSTQYAARFVLFEVESDELRKLRTAAVAEMAKFDQKKAFEYFGLK